MQVDPVISKKEQPGLALQRSVDEYVRRAVRAAPDTLPSLDSVVETLREIIGSDLGGKATAYTRRMVVTAEWLMRLDLALSAAALDDETAARVMRHVRKELDETVPTIC